VAHASQYAEYFDFELKVEPLAPGVRIEEAGSRGLRSRVLKARRDRLFPIVVGNDRRAVLACLEASPKGTPLVALWGSLYRDEGEAEMLDDRPVLLAGTRIVPSPDGNWPGQAEDGLLPGSISRKQAAAAHLSIDLDVLSPQVLRHPRSVEPGGLGWVDLGLLIEEAFRACRPGSVSLVGAGGIAMDSPAALFACQVLFRTLALARKRMMRS